MEVRKLDIETKEYKPIDFNDLKKNDIFIFFHDGIRYADTNTGDNVWIADGTPYLNEDGIQEIQTVN